MEKKGSTSASYDFIFAQFSPILLTIYLSANLIDLKIFTEFYHFLSSIFFNEILTSHFMHSDSPQECRQIKNMVICDSEIFLLDNPKYEDYGNCRKDEKQFP